MMLASIMSGIFFLLGWHRGLRNMHRVATPHYHLSGSQYLSRALMLLPVMIWTLIAYFQAIADTEWRTVFIFGRASCIAASVIMMIAALKIRKWPGKVICLGVASIFILLYLWLAFQQPSRLMFLFLFESILGIFFYAFKDIKPIIIALFGVGFIWFFILDGNARYFMFFEDRPLKDAITDGVPKSLGEATERLFISGDLDAFENGTIVMQLIPSKADFYYGGTFATLFVLPIPRAWWPEKPAASVNYLLSEYYSFQSDNFAISLQAESYANFFWPGVVIVFALFGFIAARLFRNTWVHRDDPEQWVNLSIFCAYTILVMRGSFHSMTSYYLMVFFWIYISGKAAKLMVRPPKLSGARQPQHG